MVSLYETRRLYQTGLRLAKRFGEIYSANSIMQGFSLFGTIACKTRKRVKTGIYAMVPFYGHDLLRFLVTRRLIARR